MKINELLKSVVSRTSLQKALVPAILSGLFILLPLSFNAAAFEYELEKQLEFGIDVELSDPDLNESLDVVELGASSLAEPAYPRATSRGFEPSLAQNGANRSDKNLRSRSEVVREVKRRYDAQVLKIRLNQQGSAYRVRILMPNGRVREISVSARR